MAVFTGTSTTSPISGRRSCSAGRSARPNRSFATSRPRKPSRTVSTSHAASLCHEAPPGESHQVLGREDKDVAATVAAVDTRRVSYIAKMLIAAGVESRRALPRAAFMYWAYQASPSSWIGATRRSRYRRSTRSATCSRSERALPAGVGFHFTGLVRELLRATASPAVHRSPRRWSALPLTAVAFLSPW